MTRSSIVVLPFDFYDSSIDQRPIILQAQERWLRALPKQVTLGLKGSARLRVMDRDVTRAAMHKLAVEYAHPTSCGPCLLELGNKVGADYVLAGQIRKVSDLIIYLQAQLIDVHRRQVVGQYLLEVKADNGTMWRRAAYRLAQDVERSVAGLSPARDRE